jgi:[citrate (pro-3S)-lyase] ligase
MSYDLKERTIFDLKEKTIFLDDSAQKQEVERLLNSQEIGLDKNLDYTMGIYDEERLVATGSFFKNTLRCLAVATEYQGLGLTNTMISHLMNEQFNRGYTHIFLYTKFKNKKFFENIGFYEIVSVDDKAVLMENRSNAVQEYAKQLAEKKVEAKNVAGIVVNANPFTLGHQYLIEKVSKENDVVHVFVVSEDASIVPFSVRYDLVKRGTSHLKNVIVHKAGSYIISSTTFPSYFIKDKTEVIDTQAKMDLQIFSTYIAKALGINKRYVGEEPYCEVTKRYNQIMQQILPQSGIECRVVPRINEEGKAISASRVRQLIKEGKIDEIKQLVPETTYEYFKSKEAQELIINIKNNTSRH